MTTEEFIRRARAKHGDRYDYHKTRYVSANTKVVITCPAHGDFLQIPREHSSRGYGCQECGQMRSRPRVGLEEFVRRAHEVHGDSWDYSQAVYVGSSTPLEIICRLHGSFWQAPSNHVGQRQGCPVCGRQRARTTNKLTQAEFLRRCTETHGDRYDYREAQYRGSIRKVTVRCPVHGKFEVWPKDHMRGVGCAACAGCKLRDTAAFIAQARTVHGARYDYSLTAYRSAHGKVSVICAEHGVFEQTANSHLLGTGCGKCAGTALRTHEEFLAEARAVHGAGYDYSRAWYTSSRSKVTVICPDHGEFDQPPKRHLKGYGCPACSASRGERALRQVLDQHDVLYIAQWSHPLLRAKVGLRVDFAIPIQRVLIEFDGEQHHGPVRFGGMSADDAQRHYEGVLVRDHVKDEWARAHGWRMIRIADVDAIELLLREAGVLSPGTEV